ncbi:hypothetical protein [Aeromonas caviae]|uniref:Toxin co-regulated pilus biosynthesis protein Q C-terminal domain-containing protein n=1 Tax=Aeromonas caviae TaxID=648 RepID=A0AAJ6CQ46_AERCA|nr:hypothetical protein [Aeromonas caviae]WFG00267.1 hypothetical protein P5S46_21130 [Aeromonas caviae]
MRYSRLALPLLLTSLSAAALAAVSSDGRITMPGQGALVNVTGDITPAGWSIKYTDRLLASTVVAWSAGPWSEQWDRIAREHNLYILLDGRTQVGIVSRADAGRTAASFVINSASVTAKDAGWDVKLKAANAVGPVAMPTPVTASQAQSPVSPLVSPSTSKPAYESAPLPRPITAGALTVSGTGKPVATPTSQSAVTPVTNRAPTVAPPRQYLQASLESPPYSYLALVSTEDGRLRVENGELYYLVKQGSLESNIRELFSHTQSTTLISKVSPNHMMPNTFWLHGKGVLEILDQIVAPFTTPQNIRWSAYQNDLVVITYGGKNG